MRRQVKKLAAKVSAAILIAATVMSSATPVVVRADEINPQATECVETNESSPAETPTEQSAPAAETPEAPVVEAPVAETPATPVVEAPAAETPATTEVEISQEGEICELPDGSVSEVPVVEAPVAEIPAAPVVEAPAAETPATTEVEISQEGEICELPGGSVSEGTVIEAPVVETPATPEIVAVEAEDSPDAMVDTLPFGDVMKEYMRQKAEEERIGELTEQEKSEETKKLELVLRALDPIKEATGINDESIEKAVEDFMNNEKNKGRFSEEDKEAIKEVTKLIADLANDAAMDIACPGSGAYKHVTQMKLLTSKAEDAYKANKPELAEKYMREAMDYAQENGFKTIPGVQEMEDIAKAGKVIVKRAAGDKAAEFVEDTLCPKKEYVPGLGTISLRNKAEYLLRKAQEAKTTEERNKYMREYEETCKRANISAVPFALQFYDVYKSVSNLFSSESTEETEKKDPLSDIIGTINTSVR